MVTAIAGLEEGIISGDTYVTCTGTYEYGGQTFRCNNHDTPMTLNVTDALKYSCNTFFYTVGQKLTKPSMPSTVVTRSSLLTPLELPLSSVSVSAQSPGLRAMTSALTVVVVRVFSGCPS